jgi:poly-gamma-glutamate synthesis protein (capsule biosynthesis protein)
MAGRSLLLLALFVGGCAGTSDDVEPGSSTNEKGATTAEAPAIIVEPFGPPAPTPPAEPLRVLVGGDLIPHRPSLAAPSAVLSALAPLAGLFGKADATVANYEAATGELEKKAFRLAYAAPPAWLEALPLGGIDAISVANNHACDLGYEGVEATLDAAAKSGLVILGGDTKGDPWAPRTIVERGGKRVCAVAWTTLINAEGACAKTTRLAVATENAAGRQKVAAAIQRAHSTCDATIAIIHGGVEYVPQTPAVMAVARQAADSGADAVVIHHPHVASPVVVHSTKDGRKIPIFASVGNLVSNQGESWKPPMFPVLRENRRLVCVNGWTRLGVLADLAFDFKGAPKLDWSFHLLWTDNEHAEDRAPIPKIATRLLDPDKDSEILSRLSNDEHGPVDLFDDPCWVERPIYTEGDRKQNARCETTLVRSAPPPAHVAAVRTKKKR